MYDTAIIGAGLAGITCGQYLQQQGQKVILLEKSRGLGGRLATRRLHNTIADHGAKFLEIQGTQTQELITSFLTRGIGKPWPRESYEFTTARGLQLQSSRSGYIALLGMSTIAKTLAVGLEILLNHRVEGIKPTDQGWSILLDPVTNTSPIQAKALVIAVPAPQALALLLPLGAVEQNSLADQNYLDQDYLNQLGGIEYDACITVMAGYDPALQKSLDTRTLPWQAITFLQDPILAWLGIDSTKRTQPSQPVLVIHSTPTFAAQHLESTNLNSLGQELLDRLSIGSPDRSISHLLPELNSPQWFQVHRWRYAQPKTLLNALCFPAPTASPLVCCGDWCQGRSRGGFIESALVSGLAAAQYLQDLRKDITQPP